jgi:soluble lytic murein transglycosylase-like protein
MLTLSFFLAAYLVGGGAQEARAPQVALAAILPASRPVPARVIEVWAPAAGMPAARAETVAAAPGEAEAGPAPAPRGDALASAAPQPTAGSAPAPAAAAEPQPAPAPRADVAPEPPAATPAVAPPAASLPPLSYAQVIAFAIEAGWPAELADAVARVAWCESRFRPDAVGYDSYYGLMQIVPLWFEYAGISFDHWTDPVANLKAALAAYRYSEGQGHRPWAAWGCKPDAVVIP